MQSLFYGAGSTSRIVIYSSSFGGFGNILESILKYRKKENKELIILSDLSSTNYPKCPETELFNIHYAGCSAHARRPFKRYYDQDPDLCEFMLAEFGNMFRVEHLLIVLGETAIQLKPHHLSTYHWKQILE
jgi:hypothetical protein